MHLGLEEQRKISREMAAARRDTLPPIAGQVDLRVPGSYGSIPLRIFLPNGQNPPFPTIVFFHHGGWVYGSNDESESICRKLVNATNCAVASVEYPLSPENRYPKAIDESYNVIKWLHSHAADFGGDPNQLFVCGESAGGNLATVMTLLSRDNNGPKIKGQILISPILDHSFNEDAYSQSADKYLITLDNMQWFWQQYLENTEDGEQSYASPLRTDSLQHLPKTLFILAEHDVLTDDAKKYADKLRKANIPVEMHIYPGTIHGFIDFPICEQQEQQALKDIHNWMEKALKA